MTSAINKLTRMWDWTTKAHKKFVYQFHEGSAEDGSKSIASHHVI